MTELVLIRHGETDYNRGPFFQGQIDAPLNETGQSQARKLAHRLAVRPGGEPFDQLYCSDLLRTCQTAQPLAEVLSLAAQKMPALREQSFGLLEGLSFPEVIERHPEQWQAWQKFDADYAPPGGESTRAFHARVLAAIQEIAARHAGDRVMVVTHGGVLDMLYRTVKGLPLSGPRECLIPNTGMNRLRWGNTPEILLWGDATHLTGI